MEIKKAIIPIAGLGTRFLPLSKILPKELWPLVDKPVIQYVVEEAKQSGISQIIFIISPEKRVVLDYFKKYYFKKSPKLEKKLKEQNKITFLQELKKLEELCQDLSFSYVLQKKPLGDGHAISLARNSVKGEPVAVSFGDDIVDSKTPCLLQLIKIFKTSQKPVIALHRVPKEKIPSYGIVRIERITSHLYKIKKIVEKPSIDEAPSDLAIVGKYILTPEVFDYLKKAKPSKKGEIILAETFDSMIKDGKIIYGYQFEGRWLECGNKLNWLKSHFYLSLKHHKFGQKLKEYLKEI
ncbi:UTP--glucose-1-phosphate uridylyltransferase [Patescibacteria group bacterium]|nr:UTP--glucose-1-phosphate uridylyltransferase [Patescibacteria group bacterium]